MTAASYTLGLSPTRMASRPGQLQSVPLSPWPGLLGPSRLLGIAGDREHTLMVQTDLLMLGGLTADWEAGSLPIQVLTHH